MLSDLIQNSSLLIALSVLYGILARGCKVDSLKSKILGGILFGGITVAAMKMSIHYNTGVIYDGRSIVLTLSGLFGGGITGIISALVAAAYRIYLGGAGVWAGTATIFASVLVGLGFRRLHGNKPELLKIPMLFGMGVVAHLCMLICQLLLPWPTGIHVIEEIWIPVMLILPLGTLLMGLLLSTDKKRMLAEKALRRSEENFRRSMDESPLGMRIVTFNGQTLYVNKALLNIYGFNCFEEFAQTPVEKRYTDESLKLHQQRKENRRKGEHVDTEYEIDIIRNDGQIRHIQVQRKTINWDDSHRFLVIYQDFTERKKAEDLLLLLGRSIEQSPVSMVITNPKGTIEYVNPKFSETTGYSAEEVIGKKPGILKSGEQPKEFYDNLWKTIRSGKEWRGEFHNRKKNGELYWESAVISSIVNKAGKITHYIEAKEDISEKKQIIADLKTAKEKAEESDRLKSAFLANMSHEIRTPLNSILGFSDMLTEDSELSRESKKEYSSIINRNADNLLQIIDDILDISKLDTGQVKIIKKPFDLFQTLNELYTQFQRKISETGNGNIVLKLKIPD
ncbi:MAG: PAS domain S-box protein, partial [Prolixibacteraceae bacterium]|nr:PAS domain S-box protein [Prolixibacteraceae bacterium]